jgi:hypothetical protein
MLGRLSVSPLIGIHIPIPESPVPTDFVAFEFTATGKDNDFVRAAIQNPGHVLRSKDFFTVSHDAYSAKMSKCFRLRLTGVTIRAGRQFGETRPG